MTFVAAQFVAFFIIVASLIGILIFVGSRRRAAKEEELKRVASARGWKFEAVSEGQFRVHRWTGTTDGVSWTAESLRRASGGENTRRRRRHIARWHGEWNPGISGALLGMGVPTGKEVMGAMAEGDGFFAKMAQKAAGFALDVSLDAYFGDRAGTAVDAAAMRRIDAEKIPGFVVMSAEKDEGARILAQGLERALLDATADKASVLSDEDRPWILLRPNSISLARMKQYRDINEVERFIRAGVGLTRAFKFGHR